MTKRRAVIVTLTIKELAGALGIDTTKCRITAVSQDHDEWINNQFQLVLESDNFQIVPEQTVVPQARLSYVEWPASDTGTKAKITDIDGNEFLIGY